MYTINGALGSPYSMKMRALIRYRRIPHLWVHGADSRDALSKVKAPVIPVMEYPDGTFHNDSTPLIYDLEARHSDRSVIPPDPAHAFIALDTNARGRIDPLLAQTGCLEALLNQ